jgi:hypothetical protein
MEQLDEIKLIAPDLTGKTFEPILIADWHVRTEMEPF